VAAAVTFYRANLAAEPLRLRADAIAESRAPAGLVVMQGEDRGRWIDAEALVWTGTKNDATGDVMVLSVRLREPHGLGEVRGGRFVIATGAIRPVQIDGVSALVRAPSGTSVESFAGMPVVPRFGYQSYDWVAGGRVAQTIASMATVGISYVQRRDRANVANEEVGADAAFVPVPWLDLAARGAYDLVDPGLADATASAAARSKDVRVELFASQRSPSRLLPATSLFSVLGDYPSRQLGSTVRWNAAPRLDVLVSGAVQSVGDGTGGNGWVRANLRLDDRGNGTVGGELRRNDVATAKWTGMRGIVTQALGGGFRYSTELEIAVPDDSRGRGSVWPWGLVALSWRSRHGWEVAGAVEAASTPEHRYESTALARIGRTFEVTP
jgi:hypothetical protein